MTQQERTRINDEYALHLLYTNRILVDRDGTVRNSVGKILKPRHNTAGYLLITLPNDIDGRQRIIRHHRLVVLAHHGRIPFGLFVNHIDEDKHNNHIDNLEIVTHSKNLRLRGRFKTTRLTDDDAEMILRLRRNGQTIAEIQKNYFPNNNYNTINDVSRGKTFAHIS